MKTEQETISYGNEQSEDFAGMHIKKGRIDGKYKYVKGGVLWRICSFVIYYVLAFPLVWLFERLILGVRFVNKGAVKPFRKTPYFIYGNHTGWYDAYTPVLISMPRKNTIITSPEAVSIKGLKHIVEMLGAVPIPSTVKGMKNFSDAVEYHHKSTNITVFPEAHIWPYYTGVRHFGDAAFTYPVRYGAPVFAFFTAYTKPRGIAKLFRKASMTVYVSDPIFPDKTLPEREARKKLCLEVYGFMLEKSEFSNYEVVKYIPEENNQ